MKNEIKKHRIVKRWSNVSEYPVKGEYNTGEITVVPDQSYTIQEILDRFTSGVMLPVVRNVEYGESESLGDIDLRSQVNDFTDIEEVSEQHARRHLQKKQKRQTDDPSKLIENKNNIENNEGQSDK